jgi:hypothetical protein
MPEEYQETPDLPGEVHDVHVNWQSPRINHIQELSKQTKEHIWTGAEGIDIRTISDNDRAELAQATGKTYFLGDDGQINILILDEEEGSEIEWEALGTAEELGIDL